MPRATDVPPLRDHDARRWGDCVRRAKIGACGRGRRTGGRILDHRIDREDVARVPSSVTQVAEHDDRREPALGIHQLASGGGIEGEGVEQCGTVEDDERMPIAGERERRRVRGIQICAPRADEREHRVECGIAERLHEGLDTRERRRAHSALASGRDRDLAHRGREGEDSVALRLCERGRGRDGRVAAEGHFCDG